MKIPAILFSILTLAACSGPVPDVGPGAGANAGGSANSSGDRTMTSAGATDGSMFVPPRDAGSAVVPGNRDYAGHWVGVEGMVLDIEKAGTPGRYHLTMQWDLDNKGAFDGTANGDTIAFDRNGVRETLRPTDGDATGLKYLAGKSDCLTVKTGEGYCRAKVSR